MEVTVLEKDVAKDIKWWELGIVAIACGGGVISFLQFMELNPGWDMVGRWPAPAWIMGGLALACITGFFAALYRFYFTRRYGRHAPYLLIAFILFHAMGAFLIMTRMG